MFQSNIAAGIMPVATFTAAARKTPPPGPADTVQDLNLDLSQQVIHSSLLGRQFRTLSPGEIVQDQTEDTDTSLFDYEHTRGGKPQYDQLHVFALCLFVFQRSLGCANCFSFHRRNHFFLFVARMS